VTFEPVAPRRILQTLILLAASTAMPAGAADAPLASEPASEEGRASPEVEAQRDLTTEKEEPVVLRGSDRWGGAREPEVSEEPASDDDTSHFMQVGLRAGLVMGYRMLFRYDTSPFCAEPTYPTEPRGPDGNPRTDKEQAVCGFLAPPATELALSFAPIGAFEPYLFVRLGLGDEKPTDTEALRLVGVGTRLYTMSDDAFKLFVEPAVGYQFDGARGRPEYCASADPAQCGDFVADYKHDLIFHLGIGPQYDFARYVGVYANAGLDVGIFRAIHATLFGHVGLQIRLP
jgi:hypothetical protein